MAALTSDDIRAAFRVLLMREPESDALIEWWKTNGASFRHLRAGILDSEEFKIIEEREQAARNRKPLRPAELRDRVSAIFNIRGGDTRPYEDPPRALASALASIAGYQRTQLILSLGGERAESYARFMASRSPGCLVISNNGDGTNPDGVVRLPLRASAVVDFLDAQKIVFEAAIIGAGQGALAIKAAYARLPENGAMACLGARDASVQGAIDNGRALVWGDALDVDGHMLVTRSVWPFPVRYRGPTSREVRRGTKRIGLAAIVKNEEELLPGMLTSCAKLVEHVTLVDTGSTDHTLELARVKLGELGLPYRIEHVPFENFSQARNAAIAAVPSDIDWVLMLDADEFIGDDDAQGLVDLAEADTADVFSVPRYNILDTSASPALGRYPDRQARFFRVSSEKRPHFVNPVHEALIVEGRAGFPPADGSAYGGSVGGPHIHHLAMMSGEKFQAKTRLYDALARA